MRYYCIGICFLLVVDVVWAQTSSTCQDVDTSACQIMLASKPDLCSDPTASTSLCPRFCNRCPVQCYHCNATVNDYHLCNTTTLCAIGQICMRKTLTSYIDGHHEYQMTCEDERLCDGGADLTFAFGKREIESRDIKVTCCGSDHCNYPEARITTPQPQVLTSQAKMTTTQSTSSAPQPTTSSCPKDIIFLVDETSSLSRNHQASVKNLISEVIQRLDIGTSANLVALYGYDDSADKKFDLDKYTDKQSLLSGVQASSLDTGAHTKANLHETILVLLGHIMKSREGDRKDVPDAIIIIDDSRPSKVHINPVDRQHLKQASHHIIHVSVGPHSGLYSGSVIDGLATDNNHVIKVNDLNTPATVADSIVALLGRC